MPRIRITIQIIIAAITKKIINSSQIGQNIMIFSTTDSSPNIFTVCLARKMPIEGKLHSSTWNLLVSGIIRLSDGDSKFVQTSSSENKGQTCST